MDSRNMVFENRDFDDRRLICHKCGWQGKGNEAHVADFYGIGKFKQVNCPKCQEYLGNLSRENSYTEGGKPKSAS